MLAPFGPRVRLVGAQFIIPKATEYEPNIRQQAFHTDVPAKGEVVSVALHVRGLELGTLLDAKARITTDGLTTHECIARAATSAFMYDTGTPHAGPPLSVPPPYPHYAKDRVFVLLCTDSLDPARLRQHRRDNGLRGRADLAIDLPTSAPAGGSASTAPLP